MSLDAAAERWKRGMERAALYAPELAAQGRALAAAARATGRQRVCGIRGCTRSAYKGPLCQTHWRMVPMGDRQQIVVDTMIASHRIAAKHHRRFRRELQARLDAE